VEESDADICEANEFQNKQEARYKTKSTTAVQLQPARLGIPGVAFLPPLDPEMKENFESMHNGTSMNHHPGQHCQSSMLFSYCFHRGSRFHSTSSYRQGFRTRRQSRSSSYRQHYCHWEPQ